MTPRDLISLALKQAGILGEGQVASSETMNDAFSLLNMMLGQWNRKRWLVYQLVDAFAVSTGAPSFNVGPGQAFSVVRPDRIEAAYGRWITPTGNIDFPLEVLQAYEDYVSIPNKTQGGPPSVVFYDPGFPVGKLYVWPVPPAGQFEIHVLVKQTISLFTGLSDLVQLPPEYQEAVLYNLAIRLCANFGRQPRADVMMLAKSSLNTIRNANAAVPTLDLPSNLVRAARYSVYGDTYR